MAKPSDRNRILRALSEDGALPNSRIRALTGLPEDRYSTVKQELLNEGLVKKYRTRGGGLRLTRAGKKHINETSSPETQSNVSKERDLYIPLIESLEREIAEDDDEPDRFLVRDTSSLLIRGKWSNPDVTTIEARRYEYLNKHEIYITTYEVKRWGCWDVSAVYEAASHARFAHEAYVVLEWPKDLDFASEKAAYGLDRIESECSRFGVGLMTLQPYRSKWLHEMRLEAVPKVPSDQDIEDFLAEFFEKYESDWSAFKKQLRH